MRAWFRACSFLSPALVFEANKRVIRPTGFQTRLELSKNKITPLRIPLNHIIWPQRLAVLGHRRTTRQSRGFRTRAGPDEPARNPTANERDQGGWRGTGNWVIHSATNPKTFRTKRGRWWRERPFCPQGIKEHRRNDCRAVSWYFFDYHWPFKNTHKQAVCHWQCCNQRSVSAS